jgi:hypothetical protein
MSLPIFQDPNRNFMLMQTGWSSQLNPWLQNPMGQGVYLEGVALANGTTQINHKLDRMMQGWMITDINGAATIYRSQPLNSKTLTLTSNAAVTVNLYVF